MVWEKIYTDTWTPTPTQAQTHVHRKLIQKYTRAYIPTHAHTNHVHDRYTYINSCRNIHIISLPHVKVKGKYPRPQPDVGCMQDSKGPLWTAIGPWPGQMTKSRAACKPWSPVLPMCRQVSLASAPRAAQTSHSSADTSWIGGLTLVIRRTSLVPSSCTHKSAWRNSWRWWSRGSYVGPTMHWSKSHQRQLIICMDFNCLPLSLLGGELREPTRFAGRFFEWHLFHCVHLQESIVSFGALSAHKKKTFTVVQEDGLIMFNTPEDSSWPSVPLADAFSNLTSIPTSCTGSTVNTQGKTRSKQHYFWSSFLNFSRVQNTKWIHVPCLDRSQQPEWG